MNPRLTDTELITAFQKGEAAAFETIYSQFARSLRFFIGQKVSDTQAAEDISVETFSKAFERNRDFPSLAQLKSFLFTTAGNASLDYLRTKNTHDRIHEQIFRSADEELKDVELDYIATEATRALYEAIESLPERSRQVIRMLFVEEKKLAEVAEELNISYNTVQVYRARGLETLRNKLIGNKLLSAPVLAFALAMLIRQ